MPRIIGSKSGYTPPRRRSNARGAPTRKPDTSEDAKKEVDRFVRVGKDWESHDFLKALASHDPQIGKALSRSTGAVRVTHNAQSTQPFSNGNQDIQFTRSNGATTVHHRKYELNKLEADSASQY